MRICIPHKILQEARVRFRSITSGRSAAGAQKSAEGVGEVAVLVSAGGVLFEEGGDVVVCEGGVGHGEMYIVERKEECGDVI